MYFERIEIAGFKGINRLSLPLNRNKVLIGENAWGKSSLFDALALLFNPSGKLYDFQPNDFYTLTDEPEQKRALQILFTFCAETGEHVSVERQEQFATIWTLHEDGSPRIYLRYAGEWLPSGKIMTSRCFLDEQGEPLTIYNSDELIKLLIKYHPVLRLRNASSLLTVQAEQQGKAINKIVNQRLQQLVKTVITAPQELTNKEIDQSLQAISHLFFRYFYHPIFNGSVLEHRHRNLVDQQVWQTLTLFNHTLSSSTNRNLKLLLLGVFSILLQASTNIKFHRHAKPLILLEMPESKLHPIMLTVAWGILQQLPLQKITITNSSELLSLIKMDDICRLVRHPTRIYSYQANLNSLSIEERRRIAFHIKMNKASTLFARCWLLVEGETEVWLLNELAHQCGHQFGIEGVKIIEFAQCGVKPLLKYAHQMGIEWHVLVDGDDAGKKYANTVRAFVMHYNDRISDRLTVLPKHDIEFYLYQHGFAEIFHQYANVTEDSKLKVGKIIKKAIHHSSKPDLAIALALYAEQQGIETIPLLFKKMFSRIIWLARGKAE